MQIPRQYGWRMLSDPAADVPDAVPAAARKPPYARGTSSTRRGPSREPTRRWPDEWEDEWEDERADEELDLG